MKKLINKKVGKKPFKLQSLFYSGGQMSKSHDVTHGGYYNKKIRKKIQDENPRHKGRNIIIIPENLIVEEHQIPKKISHNIFLERKQNQLKYLFVVTNKNKILKFKLTKSNKKFQHKNDICVFKTEDISDYPLLIITIKKKRIKFKFKDRIKKGKMVISKDGKKGLVIKSDEKKLEVQIIFLEKKAKKYQIKTISRPEIEVLETKEKLHPMLFKKYLDTR